MNEFLQTLIKNSFGFDPAESRHHFLVDIPRGGDAPIKISEQFTWDDEVGSSAVSTGASQDGQIRLILARIKWDAVADELRTQFNLRLKKLGKKTGNWRAGHNLVRRELGGESLVVAFVDRLGKPRAIGLGLMANCLAALVLFLLGRTEIGALVGLFFFYITFEFTLVSTIPLMTEILPSARATLLAFNVAALSMGRALGDLLAPPLYGLGFWVVVLGAVVFNLLALAALRKVKTA